MPEIKKKVQGGPYHSLYLTMCHIYIHTIFHIHIKVREFENNWLRQAVFENLFILFKRGKDVLSHEIV